MRSVELVNDLVQKENEMVAELYKINHPDLNRAYLNLSLSIKNILLYVDNLHQDTINMHYVPPINVSEIPENFDDLDREEIKRMIYEN